MDAVKAFIQFLVDLFSALSKFLLGNDGIDFDISGIFGGQTGEDTSEVPASEG